MPTLKPISQQSASTLSGNGAGSGYAFSSKLHVAPPMVSPVQKFSSTVEHQEVAAPLDASLGPLLQLLAAGKEVSEAGVSTAEAEVLASSLLEALHEAYTEESFQSRIGALFEQAAGSQDRYLWALGPEASSVQAPVFARFGLPPGGKGVLIMKNGIKKLSDKSEPLRRLAGDLRELLLLPREEPVVQDVRTLLQNVEREKKKHVKDMAQKLAKAPAGLLRPFAQAMGLSPDASVEEVAESTSKISEKAQELAESRLREGRAEVCGAGKLLGPEMEMLPEEELRESLVKLFQGYLQKMLARVITPLDSFTEAAEEFRCPWADNLISKSHALSLWGAKESLGGGGSEDWASLGIGVAVLDHTVELETLRRVRNLLDSKDADGEVTPSKDPCNVGAKSIWLNFSTEDERNKLHPDLCELCLKLAGLPAALDACANSLPETELSTLPKLRIHPYAMVANYRKGAQYHAHKDSYDGTDNQRMLTVLLYLNDDWRPGDDGELRVYAERQERGRAAPDLSRFADIAPLAGRLVLFRSRDVWHAVREPQGAGLRWAVTLWVMAE